MKNLTTILTYANEFQAGASPHFFPSKLQPCLASAQSATTIAAAAGGQETEMLATPQCMAGIHSGCATAERPRINHLSSTKPSSHRHHHHDDSVNCPASRLSCRRSWTADSSQSVLSWSHPVSTQRLRPHTNKHTLAHCSSNAAIMAKFHLASLFDNLLANTSWQLVVELVRYVVQQVRQLLCWVANLLDK